MASQWSRWAIDESRSRTDSILWHVYRARQVDGSWDYEQRTYPRSAFTNHQEILAWCQFQDLKLDVTSTNSANPNQGLAGQVSSLDLSSGGHSRGGVAHNNPFLDRSSQNVQTQDQNAAFDTLEALRRNHHSAHGYQMPVPLSNQAPYQQTMSQQSQSSALPFQISQALPRLGSGHLRPSGAALQNPRSIPRSATAVPTSSRSFLTDARSQEVPKLHGYKVVRGKDQREAFKIGMIFKALWYQIDLMNGVGGRSSEILRFIVIVHHKYHSICLALHNYPDQAATARNAKARDYIVVYPGDRPPALALGEDACVLDRTPIKVMLNSKSDSLKPTARVDLARTYTVEHKTKTKPVGRISTHDAESLRLHYMQVNGMSPDLSATQSSPLKVPVGDEDE